MMTMLSTLGCLSRAVSPDDLRDGVLPCMLRVEECNGKAIALICGDDAHEVAEGLTSACEGTSRSQGKLGKAVPLFLSRRTPGAMGLDGLGSLFLAMPPGVGGSISDTISW
jgi:hypothetical protein